MLATMHAHGPRISLEEALARCLAAAPRTAVESVSIAEMSGRVLAEDLDFDADLPPFDHAAMDGYAIRGAADREARFEIVGESRAGAPGNAADGRAACVISTGAAIPPGLDTVIPWEDVERVGDSITLTGDAREGQHVRHAGEDARRGERALSRGARLSARYVALIATLERASVSVARRPTVAVLCTGDELRDPGSEIRAGSIVDSNGPMLRALVAQAGGLAHTQRIADRRDSLEAALREATATHDVVVTVGGAADGKHDHVMPALETLGARVVFRGVAIKPGKPVALAIVARGERAIPVIAVPGNPGSAFVTFTLLGAPLLRAMQGDARPVVARRLAITTAEVRGSPDRACLVYGRIEETPEGTQFTPAPPATSGSVPGLASASALAIVAAGARVAAGEPISIVDVASA